MSSLSGTELRVQEPVSKNQIYSADWQLAIWKAKIGFLGNGLNVFEGIPPDIAGLWDISLGLIW